MKNAWLYLFSTLFFFKAYSQTNLVPNPSFEVADTCPVALDQMSRCQGWSSYGQSPDYYNSCSAVTGMAPPYTAFGYQQPVFGNAYAAFATWDYSVSNYREIIGSQLISSLSIGTKYYFSFFVSFAGTQALTMATNKMGLRFSTVPYSKLSPAPINNFAHYYCSTIITDSVNWTQLKDSFVADSIYKYIAIGNFFDDAHMAASDTLGTGLYNDDAYYYIENICLSTDSVFANNNAIKQLNITENNVVLYPNPCKDKLQIKCIRFPIEFELFDLLGQSKVKITNSLKKLDYVIDISALDNGIYLLKVNFENQTIEKQIIISK